MIEVSDVLGKVYEGTKHWSGYLQSFYDILTPSLTALGYDPVSGESSDNRLSRCDLISCLGHLGHTDTVGKCWMLWHHQQAGKVDLDQDIKKAVYKVVARTCKLEDTQRMMVMYEESSNAEVQKLLRCLATNNNPSIAQSILDWVMTDKVKMQDKTFFLAGVASTGWSGRSLVWRFFTANSQYWLGLYTTGRLLINLVRAVMGNGNANTEEEAETFQTWFSQHPIEGVERNIEQNLEAIRKIARLRKTLFNL